MNTIRLIPIELITANPWQTRGEGEAEYIQSLALDIEAHGLLQTPMGRPFGDDGGVQLAFGHNRLAAFRLLADRDAGEDDKVGYDLMPVQVQDLTDEQMAELAWAENEQRRDVTPIERARAIEKRMESFGWNQTEVAEHLGLNRSTVSNILRLLRLPANLQEALARGTISERVATALLPMYELPEHVIEIANQAWWSGPKRIVERALDGSSSDEIRELVKSLTEHYTSPLVGAVFGLDELFPEGRILGYDHDGEAEVYCGLCRSCDRRLKENGNICLDLRCYKAKTAIWKRRYLANAAAKSGIPAVDPNKGGNTTYLHGKQADQIMGIKCENLRLVYEANPSWNLLKVDGFPAAVIVCDKRNNSCSCLKGLEVAASIERKAHQIDERIKEEEDIEDPEEEENDDWDPDGEIIKELRAEEHPHPTLPLKGEENISGVGAQTVTAKELEEAARQARKDKRDVAGAHRELTERLGELAVEWLRDGLPGAIFVLVERYSWINPDGLDLEKIYRKAAREIVRNIAGEPNYANIGEMYQYVNEKLTRLGLPEVNREKTLVEVFNDDDNG